MGKVCHVIWEEEGSIVELLASSRSSLAVNSSRPEPSPSWTAKPEEREK
jgi:hypothetical protein